MTEHTSQPSIDDDAAEGLSMVAEPRLPVSKHTAMLPLLSLDARRGPAGETGLFPALKVPAESANLNERQDASRTMAETSPTPLPQRNLEPKSSRLPSVLIVEDTTELAEMLQATLQRLPLVATYETHGLSGLARFRELRPDVLIVDIGLPDISGWQVLETVKQEFASSMPAVIVITAYSDAANRLVGKLQQVDSYLVKPFTTSEVERVVRKALGGKVG